MMGNSKTVFKYFAIYQYQREEDYLSTMREKGWKLTHISFPGLYHFEACEPQKVTYRLDYNQEGIKNKTEYVQMFIDCGWEYLFDYVGYSYFCKEGEADHEREEIFCDDSSRLDMMKRVFRGRIIPLIVLFALVIMPQFFMNTRGYGAFQEGLSITFLFLAILYLAIFAVTTCQFYQYEKKVSGDDSGIKLKYLGLSLLIAMLVVCVGVVFWSSYVSDYNVSEKENGFAVEAEQLNTSVVKEFDLKKGDTIDIHLEYVDGRVHLSIAEVGKEPVFWGDFYETEVFTYEIQEDGCYQIEVSGRNAHGNMEVDIR